MSEANIDSLFQITAPRPEWKPISPPLRPSPPNFGDQLWQLTAPTPVGRPGLSGRSAYDPARPDDAGAESRVGADRWSPPAATPTEQSTSHEDSHRDAASQSGTAADSSASSAGCKPDEQVARDSERVKEADHTDDANASEAAAAAGGVAKSAAKDTPADNAEEKSHDVAADPVRAKDAERRGRSAAKAAGQGKEIEGKTATRAASNSDIAEKAAAGTSVAKTGTDAPTVAEVTKQTSDSSFNALQLSGATVEESSSATTATQASTQIGVQNGESVTASQRRAKATRSAESGESRPREDGIEKRAAADVRAVKVATTAAAHPAKEPTDAKKAADDESPDEERSKVRGKEGSARPAQRTSATPDGLNPAVGVTPNEPTAASDSTAAPDEAGPRAVGAVGNRADGLQTPLARGPRGGQATEARKSDESAQLGRVDTTRFIGRVARAFHFAQERGGTLQLRLSPPELGSLQLELTVKDGALTASLQTETQAARRLLLDHLPALRERLAEQNVRVERFDVDVRRDGQGGQSPASQQQAQQQHQSQPATPHRQPAQKTPKAEDLAPIEAIAPMAVNSTSINMVV